MTKQAMIEHISKNHGVTKASAERILDDVFSTIVGSVLSTGRCAVSKFGTFKHVKRAARKGRNPKTGETLDIPETHTIKFTPSANLKDLASS